MKKECNIIRDILPLYAESMVSPDTADFVEEHLKSCEACKKEYEQTKEPQPTKNVPNAAPLLKLSRKLKFKRIQTIALTAVFVIALFVSAFAVLDAPIYFPYSEDLVTIAPLEDTGMLITFDKKVTDFNYTVYEDADSDKPYYCDIEAWTSLWDKWFSKEKGSLSATITTNPVKPIITVYVPNNGRENVYIAKFDPNAENQIDKNSEYESGITLPRLSPGYYLILAVIALGITAIIWLFSRKKALLRIWAERIALYPVSYIISHFIVSGIDWRSYSLPRDFSLIVFISILLYSGLLLAHNIWHLKREIEKNNQ